MLSRWPLPLAIAALMVAPASAADETVTAQPSQVWAPDEVTIDMGDTVTWRNAGGFHNVEFDDGSFRDPAEPDTSAWTAERTFDAPGTFRYHCGFHGSAMSGVVRVRDATATSRRPSRWSPVLRSRRGTSRGSRDSWTVACGCARAASTAAT